MNPVRQAIGDQVRGLVGAGEVTLDRSPGDPGLFGPGSAAWRVHGDFTAMLVGGTTALLVQMLHPGALAGVWDHSGFRDDMAGRLRRTAQFISITTFGSTAQAEALIARVRGIHDHVTGMLPDGTPYSANDPALLTWVHAAEAHSFLAAHLRYRDAALPAAVQDRYYDETAEIALRLGAVDVPRDRRRIEEYLRAIRPALRYDDRTREVAAALLGEPPSSAVMRPVRDLTMQAAIDLLPGWAAAMHGFRRPGVQAHAVRAGVRGLGSVLRWALTDRAQRRPRAAG